MGCFSSLLSAELGGAGKFSSVLLTDFSNVKATDISISLKLGGIYDTVCVVITQGYIMKKTMSGFS